MKKLLFTLLYASGATLFAAWWHRRRVTILCYHGVTHRPERSADDPQGLHVHADRFAKQLAYLERHYRVISLADYLAARNDGAPLPERAVVLTFDDAYRNFLTAAWPLLNESALPVALFLITDLIESEPGEPRSVAWSPADDERFLSWEEARSLADNRRITFGSHTCSHPRLTSLTARECERELSESLAAIAVNLGQTAPPLAYPWGDHAPPVTELTRRIGYSCAVDTSGAPNGPSSDLFALGRVLIGDDDDEAAFAVRVSGLRHWLDRGRAWFTRPGHDPASASVPSGFGQVPKIP